MGSKSNTSGGKRYYPLGSALNNLRTNDLSKFKRPSFNQIQDDTIGVLNDNNMAGMNTTKTVP